MKKILFGFLFLLSLVFVTPTFAAKPSSLPTPSDGKVRACQARQDAIKNRMESLVKMAANMEEKFDSIANRVKDFYTNKVLSTGKTVANYDTLVSNIQTKKDVVKSDLNKARSDVDSFNCETGDPKTLFNQFRLDMQMVKKALKDFRTSIKNLIVAVHSIAPSPEPSASPEPTESPES